MPNRALYKPPTTLADILRVMPRLFNRQ